MKASLWIEYCHLCMESPLTLNIQSFSFTRRDIWLTAELYSHDIWLTAELYSHDIWLTAELYSHAFFWLLKEFHFRYGS